MDKIQAVILAAGRGTRMMPLTENSPKSMQEVLGRNLLEWKIEALPDEVDEVVMVIGYLGDAIKDFFGNEYHGKKIRYVHQEELNGTGAALWKAKELLHERFIVMMGDDLYGKSDVTAMLGYEWAIGGYRIKEGEATGGLITKDESGNFASILEGDHQVTNGYINTNLLMLRREIFTETLVKIPGRKEFGLPHTLLAYSKKVAVPLVEVKHWFQITAPEDLKNAEEFLKNEQHLQ